MSSSLSFDIAEAKAQAEYDRARQRRASQRSQQHSSSRATQSTLSPTRSPSNGSWRKPSLTPNNRDRRSSRRVPGEARNWFADEAIVDDGKDNATNNVPEAIWDSSSETEQSGADDALLSDFVAEKTDARDIINVSEYYLARGAPGYHYSPEHHPPQPQGPLLQERALGPGLGLPIDDYRWVLSEEENGCTMSWPSPHGHAPRTVIVIRDSVW